LKTDPLSTAIVGVSGYSRTIVARMIPSREVHDILLGHLACLLDLGGVPRAGVYDNEAALVSRHGGKATLARPTVLISPGLQHAAGELAEEGQQSGALDAALQNQSIVSLRTALRCRLVEAVELTVISVSTQPPKRSVVPQR